MKIKIKEYLISKALLLTGLPRDVSEFINSFLSIGYDSGEPFPKVLLDFNATNLARGFFTRFVVSTNLDWIWPYWIGRQFYAKYDSFSARGFTPASINTTFRNWTGIGTLDAEFESIVDPRGLLTPAAFGWSLDNWVKSDGRIFSPAKQDHGIEQFLIDGLPMVCTKSKINKTIELTSANFVTSTFAGDFAFQRVTVKNITKRTLKHERFAFAVRPYNPEGLSLIKSIVCTDEGLIFVNGKLGAVLMSRPDGLLTSHLSRGDCKHFFDEAVNNGSEVKGTSRVGLTTGIAVYNLSLKPGEETSFEIRLPIEPHLIKKYKHNKKTQLMTEEIKKLDYEKMLSQEKGKWQKKLNEGMNVSLPDQKVQSVFDANKAFMLLFYDGDYITPGPATYHHFWFRDAAYLLNALDKLGYHKETERILYTYKKRQLASGFFLSQKGEWDSTGQAIWSLMEHYRLTRNDKFLKDLYRNISRGAKWIHNKRKSNLKLSRGYKGIMPPGLSAEHFGLNDYYYWDDFWSLAGLRDAISASDAMGKRGKRFSGYYRQLEKSVNDSLYYSEEKLKKPIMPISPSRRMDSAAIGCLSAYYPCRLYDPNDLRMVNTVKFLQEKCFIQGGFFHDVNHAGYGTYLTMHVAQCYLGQRSDKAIDILNWILSVASPTHCWPEAIHPRTKGGCIGDGHHGWAAADFILLVRNILFLEENNNLIITPVLPKDWAKAGNKIKLDQAPSYFGLINYEIEFKTKKDVVLRLKNKFEKLPEKIEWNLPFKIKSAAADGKKIEFNGTQVVFSPKVKEVKIVLGTTDVA